MGFILALFPNDNVYYQDQILVFEMESLYLSFQ